MAIVFSILLVATSFIGFAFISYFLVRSAFPKIENDDWEERYIEMKKEAQKLTEARKRSYSYKG
jgi:hypothetical protein